ncbi:hypothetical protein COW94_03430 [Candidatus Peregrinibacteria bacterium CG22_combo_CG10-13_8_21_14_all_44_10]|nr:MAG: hypothetical protein COW94_03430 [Candidatus Peregrinibacteria bacterium CG22_combo_CG10-13_8_21_14_all_44_10]PIX79370.1 MAG: hypothetical protein COZ35_03555 [Candidatus Peregrinibacteria bacterium CG_4_10_14_3_um_filter_44_21]PJB88420.1 MAG: hypothetical protein CO082_04535 [Candidatus Peregrinibacteria bacterium CG_4_9_14_0_8_um_filter_44_15]
MYYVDMRKRSEIIFGLLRIPMDFFMVIFAFMIAFKLRTYAELIPGFILPVDMMNFPMLQEYIGFIAKWSILLLSIFAINNLYSLKVTSKLSKEVLKVSFLVSAWIMVLIAYFFLSREFFFSRLVLGYGWILSTILVSFGRIAIRVVQTLLAKAGIGQRRMLFLSLNQATLPVLKKIKKDPYYKVVGYIKRSKDHEIQGCKLLGLTSELKELIIKHKIEEVVQTQYTLGDNDAPDILEFCRSHHIQYNFIPDLVQIHQKNINIHTVAGFPLITLKPTPLEGWGKVWKRVFDMCGATVGLILFSPLFLTIPILIKTDSKGTILFKHLDDGSRVKRVGQYGKLFNFYKFRTMKPGTHNMRYTDLADQNTREDGPLVKIKDDPRITRLGRFLRRTDLDEIPQFFNVIKGDMSLVGPRPHLPEEVAKYSDKDKFVLAIKPGITGLAQTSGRSDLSWEEEVRLDSYYIENWSIIADIKIILKTVWAVFRDRKAS